MLSARFAYAAVLLFGLLGAQESSAQSARDVIAGCWQRGAFNIALMQICSGRMVFPQDFDSCMRGGPCFGEPPAGGQQIASGQPMCGSAGLPFCPGAQPCGRPFQPWTIACMPPAPAWAQACGTPPFPPCIEPQPCGMPGTFFCQPVVAGPPPVLPPQAVSAFNQFNPTMDVAFPRGFDQSVQAEKLGIQFAAPSIPDVDALSRCYDDSQSETEFYECVAEDALPEEYRLTRACLEEHSDDAGAAALCSTGNDDALETYQRFREVNSCIERDGEDEFAVAGCLGDQFLGEDESYYLRCVTDNKGDLEIAAVCAVAKGLNPEQQIALGCAISTGGQPQAFAACTAGRLTARELEKCWENGIATDDGCFGPNNELRRGAQAIRDGICDATGENSAVCDVYSVWHNNVLSPGPNHEVVKHLNNAISDLRDGPGENNEIVKAGKAVEDVFQSVGSALGF